MFTNWTATIDAFSGYNNTLAFTVSNEVMNDSTLAPYLPSTDTDQRQRWIPLGHAK